MEWLMAIIQGGTAVPKSIAKLIDTMSDQIGLTMGHLHQFADAKAEAKAEMIKVQSEGLIAIQKEENKQNLLDIKERTKRRIAEREELRQWNLENITRKAIPFIENESVSEEQVSKDWTAEFTNNCQDTGDEEMQSLWARLLAGEVARPGSFSKRTLAAVRLLSREDAHLFTIFCSFLWTLKAGIDDLMPVTLEPNSIRVIGDFNFSFEDYSRLESLGFIQFNVVSTFIKTMSVDDLNANRNVGLILSYFGSIYQLSRQLSLDEKMMSLEIGKCLLTDIGRQLAPISGASAFTDPRYLQSVVAKFQAQGWQVELLTIPTG